MTFSKNSAADLATGATPTELIDKRIADLSDWRGAKLAEIRKLIRTALPDVVEEWKWGKPVWSHNGILCTGEVYKGYVKTTFPKGASLDDPDHLFNSSMDGNVRRAIDFFESEPIDAAAFQALIRAASAANGNR
ncbi:hypothetical protein SAMN06295905_2023 [Devosia lucknowensis]|uniref:YdhG-like domain-containing protein n=1 Tax=Devosia lucknowensis TaxID=1096929 RepID=A0A1Y6FB06_9HYPH|nr:DUF1801 domain-containing protein [Devosia lucknowensis]SMQ72084.1 hypothetical protein SAMN06295905_2023 [Devosia lucknowensis]